MFAGRPVTVLASFALAVLMSMPTAAQETFTLRVSADTPRSGSAWAEIVEPWLQRMETASKGRLKFDRYPDGTMSKSGNTVNQVIAGVAEIGWDLPAPYGSRFASLNVTNLPGVFDNPEIAAAALFRAYELGVVGTEFGPKFKLLWVQITNNQSIFSKQKLKSTDFTGIKTGVGNKARATMVEAVKGVPVVVGPPDYYNSMQRGVIDALMTSVSALKAFKVDEQVNHVLDGPFGGGMLMVGMNTDAFNRLPADLKKIIDDESGVKQSRISSKSQWDYDKANIGSIVKSNGTVTVLSAQELGSVWQPIFDKVVEEWVAATPKGADILKFYKAELAKGL